MGSDKLRVEIALGPEPGAGQRQLESLTLGLRDELLRTHVGDVTIPTVSDLPDGAKADQLLEWGKLIAEVGTSAAFLQVLTVLRGWIAGRNGSLVVKTPRGEVDIRGLSGKELRELTGQGLDRILDRLVGPDPATGKHGGR